MDVDGILENAKSTMGPDRVFGEPQVRGGVTVIPAARVIGAGGGGADESEPGGGGGGFLVRARPAGALVIDENGAVSWEVPFDVNRIVLGGQLVGVAFFLFVWLTRRSEARAAAKASIAVAALEGTPAER